MIKNKTKLVLMLVVLSSVFVISYYFWGYEKKSDPTSVCIKDNCFFVEIADAPMDRERGLMNRTELREDAGMLFVFEEEGVYKFWMKNTLIPLDMIWMDKDGKVVYIKENAEPCKADPCESFGPDGKAKYVLEIKGGTVEKAGVKIRDEVETR